VPEFLTWKLQKFFRSFMKAGSPPLQRMQGAPSSLANSANPKDVAADFLVASMKSGPQLQCRCGPEFSWSSRRLISFFRLQPSVLRRLQPAPPPTGP
jgi:hypothetical protein